MISKKAITPIIAVILLLMMTIAGAAAAFFWFVRMQSELQGGTETYNEDLSEKISSRIEVVSTDITANDGNLTLYLKNQGTKSISLKASDITMILKDSDSDVVCSSKLDDDTKLECTSANGCGDTDTVAKNSIEAITIEITCDDFSASANSLYYYTIDFAGETATGGKFSI